MYKINNLVNTTFFLLIILFFASCENGTDNPDIPTKTGVLIVNEGNFMSGNGSISFYDEELMSITNNVIKSANSDDEVGATIQSLFANEGVGYLVCNTPDKIEFINTDDYTYLANPVTDISVPRYMVTVGDMGYVTCWGPYDNNYALPDSYISVIDLSEKEVVDTLDCGSGPEGIIRVGNKLFVANSFGTSISVIDILNKSTSEIVLEAAPQHFVLDGEGTLWVSTSEGLVSINATSNQKIDEIPVINLSGKMAINAEGTIIYIMTAEPWPGTATNIYTFDTRTKEVSASAIVSGENFYGIGYNTTTDKLYISDSKAFAGPGEIFMYDKDGTKLDEQVTSVGPNSFLFK